MFFEKATPLIAGESQRYGAHYDYYDEPSGREFLMEPMTAMSSATSKKSFDMAYETSDFGPHGSVRDHRNSGVNKTKNKFNFQVEEKAFMIKKSLRSPPAQPQFTLKTEAKFDSPGSNSSILCTVALGDGLIACGGKDNIIRVFKVQKGLGRNPSELQLITQLQNKNDPFPIWSLTRLHPNANIQQSKINTYYLAAGTESSNIYIWRFDLSSKGLTESRPNNILRRTNGGLGEVVTCLLDLENSNHLISGDSEGGVFLWDYSFGKLLKQFSSYHNGQINSMVCFNNGSNFAAASYDCSISIWVIQRQSNHR
jgi:WD40 repeat protein